MRDDVEHDPERLLEDLDLGPVQVADRLAAGRPGSSVPNLNCFTWIDDEDQR